MLAFSLTLLLISALRRSRAEDRTGPPLISAFSNQRIVYYREEKSVVLPCNASGGNIRFKWEKDSSLIDINSSKFKYTYKLNGGNLQVNTSKKCDGSYVCFAVNDYGSTFSDKVELRKSSLTSIKNKQNLTKKVNSSLILKCYYKSNSPSKVKWKKDNQSIRLNKRILMDFSGHLYFTNVDETDRGIYQCIVKNTEGLKITGSVYNISVNGNTQPKNKRLWAATLPSNGVGYLSENLALKCIFSGRNASVKWKTKSKNSNGNGLKKSELLIKNLTYEDKGSYTCLSTDAKDTKTFKIQIYAKPKWVRKPEDVETHVGSNVNFTCEAAGKPRPKIYWFINASQIKTGDLKTKRFLITNNDMTLSIQNVTMQNTMSIQCKCHNKHGYVFADTYLLVSEITTAKETVTITESQTTYGAAIGGALGGLVVLLVIAGIVSLWRYKKNISEPVESPAFSNTAYEQEKDASPTCSNDTPAYETLSSRNFETYETLQAKHCSNIYSEVLDEDNNTKMYDDDSLTSHEISNNSNVKHSDKENNLSEITTLEPGTVVHLDDKQTAVGGQNVSESEIGGENYFVLGTNDFDINNEISESTGKFGAGAKCKTVPEEHYFVLAANSDDNADTNPVNYNKNHTSNKNQNAVVKDCFPNEHFSSNDMAGFSVGTCGMDEHLTDIEMGEENYFVLDKEIR